jgi:Flp pilus assembly protein TadG
MKMPFSLKEPLNEQDRLVEGMQSPSLLSAFRRFRKDESGTLGVFVVFMMFWMIALAGIAVDVMHYEQVRVRMQQTLDRSILAAASLKQTQNPKAVVLDYFDKAGLSDALNPDDVIVKTNTVSHREIEATASLDTNPYFLDLYGYSELLAVASGVAEQRISKVEISLVVDVSRSMVEDAWGNALTEPTPLRGLKDAAKQFSTTVLGNSSDNLVSISLVPYNSTVNLGPHLFNQYNVTDEVSFPASDPTMYCIDVPLSSYTSTAIPPTVAMPQTGFFESWWTVSIMDTWYYNVEGVATSPTGRFWNIPCQPFAENYVRPMQHIAGNPAGTDPGTLNNYIENLIAWGGTGIEKGMKWGLALLDPQTRPVISGVHSTLGLHANFLGRPLGFDDRTTMKVIVLMTDGANFEGSRLNAGYRGNSLSPVWRLPSGNYSIRFQTGRPADAGTNQYWHPYMCNPTYYTDWRGRQQVLDPCATQGRWHNRARGAEASATQISWHELWQEARIDWVVWQMYARALGPKGTSPADQTARVALFSTWRDTIRSIEPKVERDAALLQICDLAKANDVIIFGVSYGVGGDSTIIQNCATEGNFYDTATPAQISAAFGSIASQISNLRLTQ